MNFSQHGKKPKSLHVTILESNLEYLQDVRNRGADLLLHFSLISRDKRTRKTSLRDPCYTQRLCQRGAEGGSDVEEQRRGEGLCWGSRSLEC